MEHPDTKNPLSKNINIMNNQPATQCMDPYAARIASIKKSNEALSIQL